MKKAKADAIWWVVGYWMQKTPRHKRRWVILEIHSGRKRARLGARLIPGAVVRRADAFYAGQ